MLRVVSLVRKRRGKGLLNLRFKWVVISSLFYVMYAVPKAEYMLRHPERYTDEEKFAFAMKIVGHMKKRARTETLVYGAENIPDDQGYIMYGNHQGKYDALGILLSLDRPCGVLWEKKQASRFLSRQVCGLINGVAIDLTDIRAKVRSIKEVSDRVKDGQNFLISRRVDMLTIIMSFRNFSADASHAARRVRDLLFRWLCMTHISR